MQDLLIKVQGDPILSLLLIVGIVISILFVGLHLKLSPVISFLLAGILVGQFGINLLPDGLTTTSPLGELAICLLLFVVGLELDSSVMNLKDKSRVLMGVFQVFGCAAIVAALFFFMSYKIFGVEFNLFNSIRIGLLCAMSSTAVVLKILEERGDSHSPYAINATSILIIQDFFAVLLMSVMILPKDLSKFSDFLDAGLQFGKTIIFVPILYLSARYLLPRALRFIAQKNEQELFMFTLLITVIASSFLGHFLCGSGAMGAFIAGFALAGSPLAFQIRSDIDPFKQVLLSIFFLMVGASFNIWIFETHWLAIFICLIFLPTIKTVMTSIAMVVTGNEKFNAVRTGLALAQIGEFSLLLIVLANKEGWVDNNFMQCIFAIAITSMMLTPFSIKFANTNMFSKLMSFIAKEKVIQAEGELVPVQAIIVGYGIAGARCAELFEHSGTRYSIVDQNNNTVEALKAKNIHAVFGDAARHEILEAAGIHQAKWLIIAVPSSVDRLSITCEGRLMNEKIHIIVRSHFVKEKTFLEEVGANKVISEEETVSDALVTILKTEFTLDPEKTTNRIDL